MGVDRTHDEVDNVVSPEPHSIRTLFNCLRPRVPQDYLFCFQLMQALVHALHKSIMVSPKVTVTLLHSQSLPDMRAYGMCSGGTPAALSPRRLMRPLNLTTRCACRRHGGSGSRRPLTGRKPRFRSLGSLDEMLRMSTVPPRDD
jgi:hypothetical protein